MLTKISIEDYIKHFSVYWSKESIKRLKMKLWKKGLIEECQCPTCSCQE